ncbi:MAG: DUF1553 domain-containing protein, partial [Planctomycetaceae bacterium]|nr:DUF1553 domain-containing protein [Planctomycetaceae bacterium]
TVSPKDDHYRRGMYTFFKRTAAHPNLVTFDCPDGNTTCVERRASNTPLQALQTLNNDVFVEASQHLAVRITREQSDDMQRLQRAFALCTARLPTADESAALQQLLDDARSYYAAHPELAAKLNHADPDTPVPQTTESAAWIVIARTVLNLDEFITRE